MAAKRPGPKDPSLQWNRATSVLSTGALHGWYQQRRPLALLPCHTSASEGIVRLPRHPGETVEAAIVIC